MKTKIESKHTPLPWKLAGMISIVNDDGDLIAKVQKLESEIHIDRHDELVANAAFIVRAVNSHEALLHACKQALEDHVFDKQNESYGLMEATANKIKKAIAQVEGK